VSTCSKVLRPMINVSTDSMNALYPQSSPSGTRPCASFSQSIALFFEQ